MIRINLLPPEIVQKRKSEGLWIYIGLAFLFVAIILGLAFVALLFVAAACSTGSDDSGIDNRLQLQRQNIRLPGKGAWNRSKHRVHRADGGRSLYGHRGPPQPDPQRGLVCGIHGQRER